jgi:hypothetical protein
LARTSTWNVTSSGLLYEKAHNSFLNDEALNPVYLHHAQAVSLFMVQLTIFISFKLATSPRARIQKLDSKIEKRNRRR